MPDDSLRIMCPNLVCRKILAVPKTARGKTVRCRGCGTNIRIPNPNAQPQPQVTDKKAEPQEDSKQSA